MSRCVRAADEDATLDEIHEWYDLVSLGESDLGFSAAVGSSSSVCTISIGGHGEDELLRREAGCLPAGDGISSIVRHVATLVAERRIRAGGTTKVVIHDADVVEHLAKLTKVLVLLGIRGIRNSEAEDDGWARLLPEQLEKLEEVREVIGTVLVGRFAHTIWVFPVELDAVEIVFGDDAEGGLDTPLAAGRISESLREMAAAIPAAHGEKDLFSRAVNVIDELG